MGELRQLLKPLPIFSPIDWQGRQAPERDWLIPGVVLKKTVCLFSGPGETGKSLIMQQLMTACALGKSWLGFDMPNVRSFGIFSEDPYEEVWRRQEGINGYYDAEHSDLGDMAMVHVEKLDDPCLYRPSKASPSGEPTRLLTQIGQRMRDNGDQLGILDNVGVLFQGNENYKEQVRPFIQYLIKLAYDIDGAIILLQHPAQAGETDGSGQSGSRVWRNSVRSMMLLGRVPDEDPENPSDERVLRFTKSNYGRRRKGMRIEWKEGLFVPCTIADEKGGLSQFDRLELRGKIDRELVQRINAGDQFTLARNSPRNVAVTFHKDKVWHRYDKKEITAACEAMIAEGRLVQVEIGTGSRREVRVRPSSILYPSERADKNPQKELL